MRRSSKRPSRSGPPLRFPNAADLVGEPTMPTSTPPPMRKRDAAPEPQPEPQPQPRLEPEELQPEEEQ
eukprot:COSAG04_NODE_13985_length_584_cov_1.752577_2_plen_67_part_01